MSILRKVLLLATALPSVAFGQTAGSYTAHTNSNLLVNGTVNGAVTADSATYRWLMDKLYDRVAVQDFGVTSAGTAAANGTALTSLMAAKTYSEVVWPYSATGYQIDGTFPLDWLGYMRFSENVISGTGVGSPQTGAGTLNSAYTNPWIVAVTDKDEMDPAGHVDPGEGSALAGKVQECRPNRPMTGDASATKRMVTCLYRGADTGTGGAAGTGYTMEVDNDVLNLNTNAGTAYEIDVNFNGTVADGQWSRGIFVTGGGVPGNNTNSTAIDINHGPYTGSTLLPWTSGVSIRNATTLLDLYARTDGVGTIMNVHDQNNNTVLRIDTNGYLTARGLAASGAAASFRYTHYDTSGTERWETGADATAESGSNAGSNFYISRRNDDGTAIDQPLTVNRATGAVGMGDGANINGLKLTAHTYATIPACSSDIGGTLEQVTDSSTNTWGDTISGGGSNVVVAFCAGVNWTVMAK